MFWLLECRLLCVDVSKTHGRRWERDPEVSTASVFILPGGNWDLGVPMKMPASLEN